jgi:hypothetical protein
LCTITGGAIPVIAWATTTHEINIPRQSVTSTATVIKTVFASDGHTEIRTVMPPDYIPPPTNSLGTRFETITLPNQGPTTTLYVSSFLPQTAHSDFVQELIWLF